MAQKKPRARWMTGQGGVAMSGQQPLILLVEDDVRLLKLMKRDLELEGYQVITTTDGKTGLQLTEDETPAVVLLDVMMHGLDGFQVCERARGFSTVPIIMVTAKAGAQDVARGFDVGADDYVVKPFGLDELLARVKAVLR